MTTPTPPRRLPLAVLLLTGLSIGLNLACGGKSDLPPVDHVFVAGYASTGIQLENSIPNQALLWVDGKTTQLSPGSASFANALAVLGTDTYVVGKDTEADGQTRTVVWTNGTAAPLTAGPAGVAYPTSIAVSNRTVLVGGDVTQDGVNIPGCIWVNGALQTMAGRRVEGVALQDERVVAAGWSTETVEVAPNYMWIRPSPMAWQDGAASRLTTGTTGGEALGVQVSGANVFVAGMEWRWNPQASKTSPSLSSLPSMQEIGSVGNAEIKASALRLQSAAFPGSMSPSIAAYWKNGNAVYLSDGSRWAQSAAICVSGNDVYVAGLQQMNDNYDAAVYWKNGVMVRLTQGNSEARTTGVVVLGSDVYVSGYEVVQGVCVATYWKNGTPIRLTDGKLDSFARGIVVQRVQ